MLTTYLGATAAWYQDQLYIHSDVWRYMWCVLGMIKPIAVTDEKNQYKYNFKWTVH